MAVIGPILLGMLALLVGLLFKAVLNWPEIGPEAPLTRRPHALFSQFYFAPDLILLALGLLISSKGVEALLAGSGIPSKLGTAFPTCYAGLLLCYFGALALCILLWFAGGSRKYIPITNRVETVTLPNGNSEDQDVAAPLWLTGLFSRAGIQNLLIGNTIGFSCVFSYAWFMFEAF